MGTEMDESDGVEQLHDSSELLFFLTLKLSIYLDNMMFKSIYCPVG